MTVNGCKKIAIIGSTGSIGQQALEVIRSNRPMFDVHLLSAHSNHELLARQVLEFSPGQVVIGQKTHYRHLKKLLPDTQVYAGSHYLHDPSLIAEADLVLNAMVGIDGLKVGLNALKQGKNLAMANKEGLVAAGSILMQTARENRALVIPVDSEHSAVFQCLHGEETGSVEKVYLTASGGPFRGMKRQDLHAISIGEALKHPNWRMGAKVSIDSATLMNKGMEAIATQWLFGLKPEQIHILIHPQSIIHSLVQFADGSIKAQLAMPDMKIPLQYALAYPLRMPSGNPRIDFSLKKVLELEPAAINDHPCLKLSWEAMNKGGNMPCVLNAANEEAVAAFLSGQIGFTRIPDVISHCMEHQPFIEKADLPCIFETDRASREAARQMIKTIRR